MPCVIRDLVKRLHLQITHIFGERGRLVFGITTLNNFVSVAVDFFGSFTSSRKEDCNLTYAEIIFVVNQYISGALLRMQQNTYSIVVDLCHMHTGLLI